MKTLVVYYSRTGTTQKIAKEIADALECDIEELYDVKNRQGFFRWFGAGRDGMAKNITRIKKVIYDPSDYDLVIIGTPIWVNATPAIRTYAIENAKRFKSVAFFCTMGGSGGKPVFTELGEIIGKRPVDIIDLKEKDVKEDTYHQSLDRFIANVRR